MSETVEERLAALEAKVAALSGSVQTLYVKKYTTDPSSMYEYYQHFTGPVYFQVGNTLVKIDDSLFGTLAGLTFLKSILAPTGARRIMNESFMNTYNDNNHLEVVVAATSAAADAKGLIKVYNGTDALGIGGDGHVIELNGSNGRIEVNGDVMIVNGDPADDVNYLPGQAAASSGPSGKFLRVLLGGSLFLISLDNV